MSIYDPLYIDMLRKYQKILKIRNNELKNGESDLLDVLNVQLAEAGLDIQTRRMDATEELNSTFMPISARISGIKG